MTNKPTTTEGREVTIGPQLAGTTSTYSIKDGILLRNGIAILRYSREIHEEDVVKVTDATFYKEVMAAHARYMKECMKADVVEPGTRGVF